MKVISFCLKQNRSLLLFELLMIEIKLHSSIEISQHKIKYYIALDFRNIAAEVSYR